MSNEIQIELVGSDQLQITFVPAEQLDIQLVPVIQQFLSAGQISYQHTQSVAATTWTINHNLGFRPAVTILSVGGKEMIAELLHTSVNQVQVFFDTAVAGIAVCS